MTHADTNGPGPAGDDGPEWTDEERMFAVWLHATAKLTRHAAPREVAGWRYQHVTGLLADLGGLFTPGPPPDRLGRPRRCWSNATLLADERPDELLYVEGLAAQPGLAWIGLDTPHAWCAAGHRVVDPTPAWGEGCTYLGIAFTHDYRRHLLRRWGVGTLLFDPCVAELLRDGIPDGAVVRAGRPLPPEQPQPEPGPAANPPS